MGDAYAKYYSIKSFARGVVRLLWAAILAGCGWYLWNWGWPAAHWHDVLSTWENMLAVTLVATGAGLLLAGLVTAFNALPGLMLWSDAGGPRGMRTATRSDLRAGGMFGRQ
jgi:hypothetical protein